LVAIVSEHDARGAEVETQYEPRVEAAQAKLLEPPKRPHVGVSSVEFNDGTRLTFGRSDIVVVVGFFLFLWRLAHGVGSQLYPYTRYAGLH
jgi:hypothetical protein